MGSGEHGLFFGGGLMWVVWLVLIVGLLYVVKVIVSGSSSENISTNKESPIDILDKRLARGEIDIDEYKRRKDELEK